MGAFSTFSLIKQKDDAIISINNNTDQLSQTIEKILRISMLKNRRDDISSAVNNIVANEGIESVRIINHRGVIKFSSMQSDINMNISHNDDLCTSCHNKNGSKFKYEFKNFKRYRIDNKNNLIYTSLPIYNAPDCYNGVCHSNALSESGPASKNLKRVRPEKSRESLPEPEILSSEGNYSEQAGITTPSPHDSTQKILGFIEIEVSIKKIISNLAETRDKLIIFTVLFALLASLITYFSIRYLIGRPVKNLVEGTKRVAEGNFKREIPPGKAELKLLADSFNTMQKQLLSTQTQLIESEKLASVGKLADEIAVEINNPLTGIIVFSESLIKKTRRVPDGEALKTVDAFKEDYQTILQEALKIRESIRNILSLTRQEKPHFNNVGLGRIITHSISMVQKFSNFRNIQIITSIPKTLPDISADHGLLEQVFLNLLLISSESMTTGGILNISAAYSDKEKVIEIDFTDTGRGIPENIVKKVFEPAPAPGASSYKKTEISLTVCKDIIEMHKGKIFINTTATGTSVKIILPA